MQSFVFMNLVFVYCACLLCLLVILRAKAKEKYGKELIALAKQPYGKDEIGSAIFILCVFYLYMYVCV